MPVLKYQDPVTGNWYPLITGGTGLVQAQADLLYVNVSGGDTMDAPLSINGAVNTRRQINLQTSGSNRWAIVLNEVTESGGTSGVTGADLEICAYTNNGTLFATPVVRIARNSGNVYTNGSVVLPADPTIALAAATKQYVDAKAVKDLQPMAMYNPLAQVVLNASTFTKISFQGTPEYVAVNGIVTSAGDITVAYAGNYLVTLNLVWSLAGATPYDGFVRIVANGRTYNFSMIGVVIAGQSVSVANASIIVPLIMNSTVIVSAAAVPAGAYWNSGLDLVNSRITVTKLV